MNDLQFYKVGDRVACARNDYNKMIGQGFPLWIKVGGTVARIDGNLMNVTWDDGTTNILENRSIAGEEEVERIVAEHNAKEEA